MSKSPHVTPVQPAPSTHGDAAPSASPRPPEPGYVPGAEGAGEEDPGASLDLVVEGGASGARAHRPPVSMRIDFVSDVSCPWCAIGLASLEQALAALQAELRADIHFQPFELNPRMQPGGQDIGEHLTQKYGSTAEQQARIRETIRQRGAEVGFDFHADGRGRIYNTFDAHRLLSWAGAEHPTRQRPLKQALLRACHRDRQPMDDHAVLLACAREAGLDDERARAVLASQAFADEVREREAFYASHGIQSVPAVVIDNRHLIAGGQPVAVFRQALQDIAAERRQAAEA